MNEIVPISTTEFAPALRARMKPLPGECHLALPTAGGTNAMVEWRFDQKWATMEILDIGDVQFGSRYCRMDKLLEHRNWVLARPNRFMVWAGDMMEAYNWHTSPGSPYEQVADPQSSLGAFCQFWAPARHRVLGYVSGNHERRHMAYGDLGITVSTLLGIPYALGRQHILVYFGEHKPFKIAVWHGVGSARTRGAVVNLLERQAQLDDSDLFIMGHLHQANAIELTKQTIDSENRTIKLNSQWAAMGSSFLDHYGSYADTAGYRPSQVKMPLAVLQRNGKWRLSLK
ncbi:MAG: hypothetical protein ACREKE_07860 [bacterium]